MTTNKRNMNKFAITNGLFSRLSASGFALGLTLCLVAPPALSVTNIAGAVRIYPSPRQNHGDQPNTKAEPQDFSIGSMTGKKHKRVLNLVH